MDMQRSLGLRPDGGVYIDDRKHVITYLALKLQAMGYDGLETQLDDGLVPLTHDMLARLQEQNRLLAGHLCPADRRIQDFLEGLAQGSPWRGH